MNICVNRGFPKGIRPYILDPFLCNCLKLMNQKLMFCGFRFFKHDILMMLSQSLNPERRSACWFMLCLYGFSIRDFSLLRKLVTKAGIVCSLGKRLKTALPKLLT